MERVGSSYMPGDPRLVQQIVCELKSQGIFDQFRKECIADVDTKPAYQNLRQRVEGSVSAFLKQQTWCSDMNKNQVREQLRKSIYESGYLDMGVERIVDQVVNPKINTVFLPQVEEVVYRFLGVQKPVKEETKVTPKVDIADLLPTDLEAVSPESVRSETEVDTADNSTLTASKTEEDESPPFEPLDSQVDPISLHEENSVDSNLSGFSGLQSHDSNQVSNNVVNVSQMDLSNQDSQISQNSSDGRLSIVISEDTKMDVDVEPKIEKSIDAETKTSNDAVSSQDLELEKSKEDRKYRKDKKKYEEKKRDEKRDKKSDDKRADKKNDRKKDKSIDRKHRKSDKHASGSLDKNSKSSSSSNSASKDREKDKYKERDRSASKHTSKHKHKEIDKKVMDRKDTENNAREEMDRANNDQKDNDKRDAEKKDSDKKIKPKDKDVLPEKSDKYKKKEKDEKNNKEKADKEERSKDKANRDKEDKNKDKSEKNNKEKPHREKSDKKKESTVDKSKEKDKSSSSGGSTSTSSKHNSSNSNSKEKRKDKEKETKSSSHRDKTNKSGDDDSKSKHKKDTKRDKQSRDDHYSFKDKKRNRRSTDRDSNDGKTERSGHINLDNTISSSSSSSQKQNSEAGDRTSSAGGNNSGNSDKVESENRTESPEEVASPKTQFNEVEKMKYIKPKFASNLKEAMRIMKIRRQIAKLERQNQLSLVAIDSPLVNGITNNKKDNHEDGTEAIEKVKYCEKVLNIVLDRNDAILEKVGTKKVTEVEQLVENENSAQRKEVADNKSEIFAEQPKFVLHTKDLSKESWEALEARLAEEMSNIDCNLYDYCEDYDCSDNEVAISPVTTEEDSNVTDDEKNKTSANRSTIVANTDVPNINPLKDDIRVEDGDDDDGTTALLKPIYSLEQSSMQTDANKHIERSDNDVSLTIVETGDNGTVEELNEDLAINEEVLEVIEQPLFAENIVNEEIVPIEHKETDSGSVTDEITIVQDIIGVSEEIVSHIKTFEAKDEVTMIGDVDVSEEIVKPIRIVKSDIIEGMEFVEQVVEFGQDDLSEEVVLMEPIIETVEEIIVTEPESECRYLETQTPYLKKNLENLYRFIKKLQDDVEHCIKACQNNFAPTVGGTKRKYDAIVDIKNNNKHHYEEKVSCNALERFPFPPSPADSEQSCDKKENEITRPTKQRKLIMTRKTPTPKTQRYSSDDLYKPRPVFGSSRRSRNAKVNET